MVGLEIREGGVRSKAVLTQFPAIIGRSERADLRLPSPGVWDSHCEISLERELGKFRLRQTSEGIVLQNGEKIANAFLRNGDIIQLGAAELLFQISPAPQSSLRPKEAVFWALLGLVFFLEMALAIFV